MGIRDGQFEQLESRTMLSGTPLGISQLSYMGGTQLKIMGSAGDDVITVKQTSTAMLITNGTWSTSVPGTFKSLLVYGGEGNDYIKLDASVTKDAILYGAAGNDTLVGGSGDDRLYGGDGVDQMAGGAGNDLLVSIGGGTTDALAGGTGNDSFWADTTDTITDVSSAETINGYVHRVTSFMDCAVGTSPAVKVTKEACAGTIVDPLTTSTSITYKRFSSSPLFSDAGPGINDIQQGSIGDCYFLSVLSSVAKVDPNLIRQSVADLGDGTYAVRFVKNGANTFVRVDADLPTYSWGGLAYAGTGAQGSIWVAIMEKAFTFFRSGQGTYQSISAGWMSEVYTALGKTSTNTYTSSGASWLMTQMKAALDAGKSVTYAVSTVSGGAALVAGHAYEVDAVTRDAGGNVTGLKLRNPWGIDGAGNDGKNDGYVTITAAQAQSCLLGFSTALV